MIQEEILIQQPVFAENSEIFIDSLIQNNIKVHIYLQKLLSIMQNISISDFQTFIHVR